MIQRALILGARGQAGLELQRTAPNGVAVIALDLQDVDIREHDAVASAITTARPEVIMNCAAFTNVDGAEQSKDDAMAVNGIAPGTIAQIAAGVGARVIHVSTDYVFDGMAHSPYVADAPTGPVNAYGVTKLEGERRVLSADPRAIVVRTAWLHSAYGKNFVKTAVGMLSGGQTMRVVDDQIGTPTRANHLARAMWQIAETPSMRGLFHFTDAGVASWYDVAVAVGDELKSAGRLGAGAVVAPIETTQRPSPARRPPFAVLNKHATWHSIGIVPTHWRHGVAESVREILGA
jgi:dTDP-4-dehydrorhamnose reductase